MSRRTNTYGDERKQIAERLHIIRPELDRFYMKLDKYQRQVLRDIDEHSRIFIDEAAGYGKTSLAVHAGLTALLNGYSSLIYYRFPSRRGERLGFDTGDLKKKESKYMYPFYEALAEMGLPPDVVDALQEQEIIEMRTDTTERGRNIKKSFVIIDEAQNAEDLDQLKLILTRGNDHTKIVIMGDSGQQDNKVKYYTAKSLNAFQVYMYHLTRRPWAIRARLYNNYRGEMCQWSSDVGKSLSIIDQDEELTILQPSATLRTVKPDTLANR